jgi:uncharacterized protein (DUF2236 family)
LPRFGQAPAAARQGVEGDGCDVGGAGGRRAGADPRAARANLYAALRVAAAPRFLGRLRKQLDADVIASLVDEQAKDLLQLDRRSLTQQLFGTAAGAAP